VTVAQPKVKGLLSSDHFSVDGTLIEAWASIKSFRSKDGGDDDRQGPGRNAKRNAKVNAAFTLALAAYNLIRLPKLLAPPIWACGASGVS
jgi:hypothetical protein